MSVIIEFLKVLGPLLRKGKLSYDDALKRFRAQYGRNAEGVEKVAIKSEIEKAPPVQGWNPRVIEGGKEHIAKIKRENKEALERFKEKTTPKVYSKGDEGFDEITEKLGITARPGHPLTLEGKADLKLVKPKKRDRLSIRLMKNFDQELDDITLAKEGYNLQEIGILQRARKVMKEEGQNPDDALSWVRGEMADDAGIEFEEFMPDFDWGDFPGKAEGGRIGMMYGGDPGFAFEYGGSWADWHDQHRDQMPVEQYIKTKLPKHRLPFREMEEGGIARAGFPFGGPALKAIRDAWRANKTWGVGGPPFRPEKTSFNIKELTKQNFGEELSLTDLRRLSESPLAGPQKGRFKEFNQEFKIIKARILKEKMMEAKLEAKASIHAANKTMKEATKEFESAFGPLRDTKKQEMAKKITDQMTRESKETLKEVREGLKEIDIYMGMLQKKGRSLHQSGGLAYMLGEPTYMKYGAGGSVGHAPWHKPTGQQQQQPQQQLDTPPPQIASKPDPLKAPRGLPSLAPKNMDPQYMQQQMMQKAMMGQGAGNTGQGPRPMANAGGRIGFDKGKKVDLSKRRFLKGTGAAVGLLSMLPFVGKFFKGAKLAKPAAAVTETITRGADGMPKYITDLIEVVKAKGTKDIIEGFKRSDYSTVHSYKGVDVIEDPLGNIKIKSDRGGVATDSTTGKLHEGIAEERHMQIEKGEYVKNKKGKMVKAKDEYIEGSVRPDMDGKMKDFEEGLDDAAHLEFKKIADEINEEVIIKKASGGLAYMLGE